MFTDRSPENSHSTHSVWRPVCIIAVNWVFSGRGLHSDCTRSRFCGDLSVSLRPVVGFAEHLAVADVCSTAMRPGGHMVGVHFGELPDAGSVGIVADCAIRAV